MRSKLLTPTESNLAPDRARPMLDHFAALNQRSRARRKRAAEPEVGIFFVYEGRLLIDATPVSEAESYGSFKGHATGHDRFWQTLQRNNLVPREVEYDEVPRGRVGYDIKERRFYIMVDACIKKNERIIDRIERDMNLPSANTAPPKLDSHYKCPGCMKPTKTKEQLQKEEEDWNF